jgi:hypothetical protein
LLIYVPAVLLEPESSERVSQNGFGWGKLIFLQTDPGKQLIISPEYPGELLAHWCSHTVPTANRGSKAKDQ